MRLLIAEDDKALALFLRRGLEADGHRVRVAYDGGVAVDAFREELPDLTILDLNLPVKDGEQVLTEMRRLDADLPVLVLTEQITRYLDLASSEAKLTAANMANIDTPGYRAIGMDFEAEMRGALDDVNRGTGSRPVRVRPVDGLIARPDGNDVSMDRESLNLAEAQLRFKTGVALLREEYQQIMDAIHVDK